MPETTLAGLPRLVRVAAEVRWRGQSALGIALAVAGYWTAAWLLAQPVRPAQTALATAAVGLPTALVLGLASGRRLTESLRRTLPPPRGCIHETPADARERRTRLAGIVLTGVVVLLLFDRASDGGGIMAGLVAGLFGAFGAVDLIDARGWEAAEGRRRARLFALVRPHALSARLGAIEIYEMPRADRERPHDREPSPFDLEL